MDILSLNKQSQEYNFSKNITNIASPMEIDYNNSDLQQILYNLHDDALQKISEKKFLEAIADLLHCEEILEAVTAKGELTDIDEVIVLLTNIAMCYQRIGEHEKALAYLDGSLYNFKLLSSKPSLKNDIKINSLIAKISLQSCAMLSQQSLHKNAIKFANNSLTLMNISLTSLIKYFNKNPIKLRTDTRKIGSVSFKGKLIPSKNSGNALKLLEKYFNSGSIGNNNKYKFRFPEWTKEIAISDFMLIQPISLLEFKEEFSIVEELSIDSLIYKICLLGTSHYCIATELNYIKSMSIFHDSEELIIEKEYNEALHLFSMFLPKGSNLFLHVYDGYIKNFPVSSLSKDTRKESRVLSNPNIRNRKKCLTPVPPKISHKLSGSVKKIALNNPSSKVRRYKTMSLCSEI